MKTVTTVTELRAMLREEAAEPLSYPRLGGVSGAYLAQYNKGYTLVCRNLAGSAELIDAVWFWRVTEVLYNFEEQALPTRDPFMVGYYAALAWIRTEFDGIEVPK